MGAEEVPMTTAATAVVLPPRGLSPREQQLKLAKTNLKTSLLYAALPLWLLFSNYNTDCDSNLVLWMKMQASLGGLGLLINLLVLRGVGLPMMPMLQILALLWCLAQGAATEAESRTDIQRV